jgi:hypothetical protein
MKATPWQKYEGETATVGADFGLRRNNRKSVKRHIGLKEHW